MGIATLSLWHGLSAAWTDASTLRARATVNGWRDGSGPGFTPALWEHTLQDLQTALQTTPDNAQFHVDLGFLMAARAQGLGAAPAGSLAHIQQQNLLNQAIAHYRAACALRPTFPYTWAYLALAKHLRNQHDDEFWLAFDHALQYGRNEAKLQPTLADLAFALWPTLQPQRQQAITAMVDLAQSAPRKTMLDLAQRRSIALAGITSAAP